MHSKLRQGLHFESCKMHSKLWQGLGEEAEKSPSENDRLGRGSKFEQNREILLKFGINRKGNSSQFSFCFPKEDLHSRVINRLIRQFQKVSNRCKRSSRSKSSGRSKRSNRSKRSKKSSSKKSTFFSKLLRILCTQGIQKSIFKNFWKS